MDRAQILAFLQAQPNDLLEAVTRDMLINRAESASGDARRTIDRLYAKKHVSDATFASEIRPLAQQLLDEADRMQSARDAVDAFHEHAGEPEPEIADEKVDVRYEKAGTA